MGLFAAQHMLVGLTQRVDQISAELDKVCSEEMTLSQASGAIGQAMTGAMTGASIKFGGKTLTGDDAMKALKGSSKSSEALNQFLDAKKVQLQTQLQAAQTFLQSVQKQVDYATGDKSVFAFGPKQ